MNNQSVCNLWPEMYPANKSLDDETVGMTPQALFDTVLGPIRWNLIVLGFELSIFDALDSAKTAKQLADELSLHHEKTMVLLDALCSLDIVTKQQQQYVLQPNIAPYLQSSSDQCMRIMLLHLSKSKHASIDMMMRVMRTGEANHLSANFSKEDFWDKAMPNLQSFHRSLSNEVALTILQGLPIWKDAKKILDFGAGSDCLATTIVERFPSILPTVFDLPSCAAKITSLMSEDMQEKITVLGGNYNHDAFGENYDVIWCSMALYYAHDLSELLYRAKNSLTKSGVFVSFHEGLTNDRTKPETHVVGRFLPALNGSDVSFSQGQIANTLRLVGFSRVNSQTIETAYGPMELDVAYR